MMWMGRRRRSGLGRREELADILANKFINWGCADGVQVFLFRLLRQQNGFIQPLPHGAVFVRELTSFGIR